MPPSFAVQLAVPILRDFRTASTDVDIDLISPYGVGRLGDVTWLSSTQAHVRSRD